MRQVIALSLVLAASPALAAHCPHGYLWRVSLNKCVGLLSPAALAYERPLHRVRIKIPAAVLAEPPIRPSEAHLQDADPDITDIPLPDPDPLTTVLKQQMGKR